MATPEVALDNFDKLFQMGNETETAEKIIKMFYDSKNINMKTHVPASAMTALITLEAYAEIIRIYKLKRSAKLTKELIRLFKELMVSLDREGRKEGMGMLGAIRQQLNQSGILAKLFGVDKE